MKEQPIEIWREAGRPRLLDACENAHYNASDRIGSYFRGWHGVSEGTARVAAEYMNNGKRPLASHIRTVILLFQAGF